MNIRKAEEKDFDGIWAIFREVVATGDTYAYAPNTTRDQAYHLWFAAPATIYVAVLEGEIVGTYYLKANQPTQGAHVCNAGYMVAGHARGQGLGREMCLHSQLEATKLGFKAMQFNLVVSTNTGAVRLWESLGFDTVGTLPKAFKHPQLGFVDALVMYRWLESAE